MPFELVSEPLPGLKLLSVRAFTDARGYFKECYNAENFGQLGLPTVWQQDNLSHSIKGVVRGLHFQVPPAGQFKLVTVLEGEVLDVVVDLRVGSPTYGHTAAVALSAQNHRALFVPVGFAHGFAVHSATALFHYKVGGGTYDPAREGGIRWNDPTLNVDWGVEQAVVSEKDAALPRWEDFQSPFTYQTVPL